jgi:polyisoprenoid-binding protein YceI
MIQAESNSGTEWMWTRNSTVIRGGFLLMITGIIGLTGCTALITPDVETEVTKLREGQYRIDPRHTSLIFRVNHLGLSTYVGRFNDIEASLDFDPDNIENTRLDAVIRTGSVDVNDEDMEETLAEKTWFDSGKFPEAVFTTTSIEVLGEDTFVFNGDLQFRGVTAPLKLEGRFLGGAINILTGRYTLGFTATGSFSRSEFGMDEYIPAVGDRIELEIHAEFQKR